MWALLEQYCIGKQQARSREELLPPMNKPFTENGRTYFSGVNFKQFLDQQRMRINERQLWAWLRDRGADHHGFNIKGRFINVWSVPAFNPQSEDFTVPRLGTGEEEELIPM